MSARSALSAIEGAGYGRLSQPPSAIRGTHLTSPSVQDVESSLAGRQPNEGPRHYHRRSATLNDSSVQHQSLLPNAKDLMWNTATLQRESTSRMKEVDQKLAELKERHAQQRDEVIRRALHRLPVMAQTDNVVSMVADLADYIKELQTDIIQLEKRRATTSLALEFRQRTVDELNSKVKDLKAKLGGTIKSGGGAAVNDAPSPRKVEDLEGQIRTLSKTIEHQMETIDDLTSEKHEALERARISSREADKWQTIANDVKAENAALVRELQEMHERQRQRTRSPLVQRRSPNRYSSIASPPSPDVSPAFQSGGEEDFYSIPRHTTTDASFQRPTTSRYPGQQTDAKGDQVGADASSDAELSRQYHDEMSRLQRDFEHLQSVLSL